ncbi:MAG TPA: UDP-3-O-acyl-N-acetylglucosamine deacetylase [Alphaproteobacteria bacterium]|nr:UDP-3-O-acyl-N-acetylglucosamine deacetylase [Alphaproteobacteria bacterium]
MAPYDVVQPNRDSGSGLTAVAVAASHPTHQQTLRGTIECSGIGVHSGARVRMRLLPAEPDTGIVFIRTDLVNGARKIPARWDYVVNTKLCTVIGNDHGAQVGTIEHLMAALRACNVDNAIIEIDGAEVPVMDGSSDPFLFMIEMAGIAAQNAPRREIRILAPLEAVREGRRVSLTPGEEPRFSFEIDFEQQPIAAQSYDFTLSPGNFKSEIGRARTFGFYEDVEQLREMGLARGGSLDNAVVIKDDRVINDGGLRYGDEFVRHKLLDAIGDMGLAGAPIIGHFHGYCSGHELNNRLLRALFADPSAWRMAEASTPAEMAA